MSESHVLQDTVPITRIWNSLPPGTTAAILACRDTLLISPNTELSQSPRVDSP